MKKIKIFVSMDWEGRDLDPKNLEALRQFRIDYPGVAILQFLNGAYFTKENRDFEKVKNAMESVFLPIDELGLHIHGWKSQFEACGIEFKNSPSFNHGGVVESKEGEDIGHDIPISEYSVDDLVKVIQHSKKIFEKSGWGKPISFRAGGWDAKENVLDALEKEGFTSDHSGVPTIFLKDKRVSNVLHDWLVPIWEGTEITTQPYPIRDTLWEYPNNGCLADYMEGSDMLEVVKENWKLEGDSFVSIGLHQETAEKYLPRVRDAIELINASDMEVEWCMFPLNPTK
jgi:hypothetical protein